MNSKHLLSLCDIRPDEIRGILSTAADLKQTRGQPDVPRPLAGNSIGMIFSKSSTRTRVSFQVAVYELGGHSMFFDREQLQLGRGESMPDTAKVLSRYLHAVVIRTHEHAGLVEYARYSTIPVINALTDKFHPCQLLADLQTIAENSGGLEGVRVAYLGDGASNLANSWAVAARLTGIQLCVGAPEGFHPDLSVLDRVDGNGQVEVSTDPIQAVTNADFIYTDVWVSMGFEAEADDRLRTLAPYQVNQSLLAHAAADVKVMHCLPAYRGKEITADVLDGPQSIVWDQAENRLHVQKAVLSKLIR